MRDFGRRQGSEARESPQRALNAELTKPGKCQFALFKLSYFLLHNLPDNHAAVKQFKK